MTPAGRRAACPPEMMARGAAPAAGAAPLAFALP